MMSKFICAYCGKESEKYSGHLNRAKKVGLNVYCDKTCSGLGRRSELTIEQKKAIKSEYDKKYRELNREKKKRMAHEYFKRTYDPVKAAIERKKRMPKHVEYCRRPEYKKKKQKYDEQYRAKKHYGEQWESAIILKNLFTEIGNRQVKQQSQLICKSQKRKRSWKTKQNQNFQRVH